MRGLGAIVIVIVIAACGRVGFEPIASRGEDAGSPADGAVLDDGAPLPDGFTGGPGVRCGAIDCLPPDRCCQVLAQACQIPGTLCEGFYYNCDGPEDCAPGEVCCRAGTGSGTSCTTACSPSSFVVCHGDGDCPGGETCCPGGNFRECRASCP